MDNGWIKLHRKAKDNEITKDFSAWGVFTWILLSVNRDTGQKEIGRFWLSEELGINPSTLYKILKRLEKKYKVVTLNSNNRFTTISVINWDKYQYVEDSVTQSSNNKVTTKEQQSNTLQEYKNKEIENISTTVDIQAKEEKVVNKLNLSKSQLITYAKVFTGLTTQDIKTQADECNKYMTMSSMEYKNPGLFFKSWLERYQRETREAKAKEERLQETLGNLPNLTPEQIERNRQRIAEIKSRFNERFNHSQPPKFMTDGEANERKNQIYQQLKELP